MLILNLNIVIEIQVTDQVNNFCLKNLQFHLFSDYLGR